MSLIMQVYPRARWPTPVQIRGYGAWGGVAAATILYVIQVSCLFDAADSAAASVIPCSAGAQQGLTEQTEVQLDAFSAALCKLGSLMHKAPVLASGTTSLQQIDLEQAGLD